MSTASHDSMSTFLSWSVQPDTPPLTIVRADGVYLYTDTGHRLLDFSSQLMNVNLGHNHPGVRRAVTQQMADVSVVSPSVLTPVREALGRRLADLAPGNLSKTFFTNGGADAVEAAIKMARAVTGRHKIVTKYRSFHGGSGLAMAASGDPRRLGSAEDVSGMVRVDDPYCYRCPWGKQVDSCARECATHVEDVILKEGPETIAALLIEGESGTSGCIKYPDGYWQKMREIADRYGIVLISDEVMSGFGRCGEWFAVSRHGVVPDMIVMAKGLTCGYIPMGGVIVSDPIARYFDTHMLSVGLTTSSHPLACAAAVACLDAYDQEQIFSRVQDLEGYLADRLDGLKQTHECVGDVRLTGLLGVIELVTDRERKTPTVPWNAKGEAGAPATALHARLIELGLFTFVRWNYVFVAPPLISERTHIDEGIDKIAEALA